MERILFVPDLQCPEHDQRAIDLMCLIMKEHIKPDRVVYLGDAINLDALSKYDKLEADVDIEYEIDTLHRVFRQIQQACKKNKKKKTRFQFIAGNHEERLPKHLWNKVPALADMRQFSMEEFLGLKKFDIEGPFNRLEFAGGNFLAVHGHPYAGTVPGSVARKWMDVEGRSGICGHIHRLCLVGRRSWDRQLLWAEGGSLCLNPQRYMNKLGDWQLGFCWGFFSENDFQLFEVRFHDNYSWISPSGKEFRA